MLEGQQQARPIVAEHSLIWLVGLVGPLAEYPSGRSSIPNRAIISSWSTTEASGSHGARLRNSTAAHLPTQFRRGAVSHTPVIPVLYLVNDGSATGRGVELSWDGDRTRRIR